MRRPEIVERIRNEVRKMPQVEAILYGSEARGDARPDSDIDLLMLVDKDKMSYEEQERIIEPLYDIELDTGIVISAIVMPRREWLQRPFATLFERNVKNDGIVL